MNCSCHKTELSADQVTQMAAAITKAHARFLKHSEPVTDRPSPQESIADRLAAIDDRLSEIERQLGINNHNSSQINKQPVDSERPVSLRDRIESVYASLQVDDSPFKSADSVLNAHHSSPSVGGCCGDAQSTEEEAKASEIGGLA